MSHPEFTRFEFVKKSDYSEVCDEILNKDLIGNRDAEDICSLFGLLGSAAAVLGSEGLGLSVIGTACGFLGQCTLIDVIEDITPCNDVTVYYYRLKDQYRNPARQEFPVLLLFGCGDGDPLTVDDVSVQSVIDTIDKAVRNSDAGGFKVGDGNAVLEFGGFMADEIDKLL